MAILASDYQKWGDRFNKKNTVPELRALSIPEIVKTIPGGWWKFLTLLLKAKLYTQNHAHEITAYPGIVYTLRTLADRHYRLLIVTSNRRPTVQRFLGRYNLADIFLDIIPTKGLFRKAKTLKFALKKYHLKPREVYYIGDEIRDIEACRRVGIPIIAVSYGFNSYEGLKKYQPTHLLKKPTQLLQLLAPLET
jgi:phosphoglycolate phosphatase-like HAD superfamily hydrolase